MRIGPTSFVIDGIDRLGKSTLANNIIKELGYHQLIHLGAPISVSNQSRQDYQRACHETMFKMLSSDAHIIYDRSHLSETVYAPLYRNYNGNYVFNQELANNTDNVRLILLMTSNFDMLQDDGESHNWDNKVVEQQAFLNAFTKSNIADKVIIDVHAGNGLYKNEADILKEALKSKKLMYFNQNPE